MNWEELFGPEWNTLTPEQQAALQEEYYAAGPDPNAAAMMANVMPSSQYMEVGGQRFAVGEPTGRAGGAPLLTGGFGAPQGSSQNAIADVVAGLIAPPTQSAKPAPAGGDLFGLPSGPMGQGQMPDRPGVAGDFGYQGPIGQRLDLNPVGPTARDQAVMRADRLSASGDPLDMLEAEGIRNALRSDRTSGFQDQALQISGAIEDLRRADRAGAREEAWQRERAQMEVDAQRAVAQMGLQQQQMVGEQQLAREQAAQSAALEQIQAQQPAKLAGAQARTIGSILGELDVDAMFPYPEGGSAEEIAAVEAARRQFYMDLAALLPNPNIS